MKLTKYLIPLWIGIIIYCTFSISMGPKGIFAYNQLDTENEKKIKNIEILTEINNDLLNTKSMLINDRYNFNIYARELGFASPGEHFIRIIGLGGLQKPIQMPGNVIYPIRPDYIPNIIIQIFSFFMGFTILLSMIVYDFLRFLKEKPKL